MKVLCIGSAVMDIMGYPIDQRKEWKEKQRISDIRILPGGDAVNQSVYMAQLGAEPALVCCVGQDMNGKILRSTLKEMQVDVSLVKEKGDCATGTAMVLVSEDGERRTFSVQGAHSTLCAGDVPKVEDLPESCMAISLASLFSMPEWEANGLLEYLKEAKEKGLLVFADLAADKLGLGLEGIRRFLPYIDYFLPSLYDILDMTETSTAEEAAEAFHKLGVANVVIKCGERGCYYSGRGFAEGRSVNDSTQSDEICGWAPSLAVHVVDTTGAGDCTVAAFVSRILKGDSLGQACRYACAAGSLSTTFAGASTAVLEDEKLMYLSQS